MTNESQSWVIYDGDIVCIDGTPYNLGTECWIIAQKKIGDMSPYPFDGFVIRNGTKTDHLVQFKLSEVTAIKRLVDQAHQHSDNLQRCLSEGADGVERCCYEH